MALVRWDPVSELDGFQTDMNRLFDGFFNGDRRRPVGRRWIPSMDLVESGGDLVLRADLPGLDEDDVKIEVNDNTLMISGERKAESEAKEEGHYRIERAVGSFSRTLTLPDGIDADRITAGFSRGVLEVRIPKPEERKPKRIRIREGERTIEAGESG